MSALSDAAAAAILQSIWQNAAIGVALWATLGATRRASANVRYVIFCAGLAAMVLVPMATFVEALSSAAPSGLHALAAVDQRTDLPLLLADGSRIWTNRSMPAAGMLASLYGWIVPLWLAGAVLASIRLLCPTRHVRAGRRSGVAAPAGIASVVGRLAAARVARRITVIVTARTESPATAGWLKPVILLRAGSVDGPHIADRGDPRARGRAHQAARRRRQSAADGRGDAPVLSPGRLVGIAPGSCGA